MRGQATNSPQTVVSSVYVERGLIALRYMTTPVGADWPIAEVQVPAELSEKIQLVSAPGVRLGVLAGPGACCVAVVEVPGVLRIALTSTRVGGSLDAVVKVEPLYAGLPDDTRVASSLLPAKSAASSVVLGVDASPAMIAHISRRGDVNVGPGEWVAGPEAPAAIEGLQIQPSDRGPKIETRALIAGQNREWTGWVNPGTFVGSRGLARSLVGLQFRLAGPSADRWIMAVEANFLGAASVLREGREIEMTGSFPTDPLVGLRLRLRALPSVKAVGAPSAGVRVQGQGVRIFRAGSVS